MFGDVDNSSAIAREEIFGPVLSVIPAGDEDHAVRIANDTIYGLNASVFTGDVDRARQVAGRLRSGTVGHNAFRTDFGSIRRVQTVRHRPRGRHEGLPPFLETKTVILEGQPEGYEGTDPVTAACPGACRRPRHSGDSGVAGRVPSAGSVRTGLAVVR